MNNHQHIMHRFEHNDALAEALLQQISAIAAQCIRDKGRFVMVLAGGNSPRTFYKKLAASKQQWQHWQLIYGDERYLAVNDSQRNNMMVEDNWLNLIDFPEANHHIVPCSGNIEHDAAHYSRQISSLLPADVALLGVGEDGHSASLFPDFPVQAAIAYAVHNAPKPPPQRITLSEQTLNRSSYVFFIASGKEKEQIIQQGLHTKTLPFSRISGVLHTQVFLQQ